MKEIIEAIQNGLAMCHLSSRKEASNRFKKVYSESKSESHEVPEPHNLPGLLWSIPLCPHIYWAILLHPGSSGSPSKRICTAEVQPVTVILSNGSSGDLPASTVAPSPSSVSHDSLSHGLSPTKYTRAALTSETSAARSSSAGDNAMPSREGLIVISPRKQRGREK